MWPFKKKARKPSLNKASISNNKNNQVPTRSRPPSEEDVELVHLVAKNFTPKSYIKRTAETDLEKILSRPSASVVSLHGPSKQGKSTVIRSLLRQGLNAVWIEAPSQLSKDALYEHVLAEAGFQIEIGHEYSHGGLITIRIPEVFEISGGGEKSTSVKKYSGRVSDAAWVSKMLNAHSNYRLIIIDNFHYFSQSIQQELAVDFSVFAAAGISIVAAGTWQDPRFLVRKNSDLNLIHEARKRAPLDR